MTLINDARNSLLQIVLSITSKLWRWKQRIFLFYWYSKDYYTKPNPMKRSSNTLLFRICSQRERERKRRSEKTFLLCVTFSRLLFIFHHRFFYEKNCRLLLLSFFFVPFVRLINPKLYRDIFFVFLCKSFFGYLLRV